LSGPGSDFWKKNESWSRFNKKIATSARIVFYKYRSSIPNMLNTKIPVVNEHLHFMCQVT
jgi:hypothetical protein